MPIKSYFRPLYLVERMIETLGTSISYIYDDLVFLEHGDTLIQFNDDEAETIHLYTNKELQSNDTQKLQDKWLQSALQNSIRLVLNGTFNIEQIHGTEEIRVEFNKHLVP